MLRAPSRSATEPPLATASPPSALISATTSFAAWLEPPLPSTAPPRSFTTTRAPRRASSSAWALPSPPPAPVTIATLPSKRMDMPSPPRSLANADGHQGRAGGRTQDRRAYRPMTGPRQAGSAEDRDERTLDHHRSAQGDDHRRLRRSARGHAQPRPVRDRGHAVLLLPHAEPILPAGTRHDPHRPVSQHARRDPQRHGPAARGGGGLGGDRVRRSGLRHRVLRQGALRVLLPGLPDRQDRVGAGLRARAARLVRSLLRLRPRRADDRRPQHSHRAPGGPLELGLRAAADGPALRAPSLPRRPRARPRAPAPDAAGGRRSRVGRDADLGQRAARGGSSDALDRRQIGR